MIIDTNGQKVNLPDFFIVGAAKSGTTSLAKYLAQHPQIYIPEEKELHFFLFADETPVYYKNHILGPVLINTFEEYVSFYDVAKTNKDDNAKLGDCSVTYMYIRGYKKVIKNIKKYYPKEKYKELKFICILRNPIERAFSQYITRLLNKESLPFLIACFEWEKRKKNGWSISYDYLGFSFYYESLKGYIDAFGKKNVKVYLFEELKENPNWLLQDLFKFLKINEQFLPKNIGKAYNVSKIPKSTLHKIIYNFTVRYNPLKPLIKKILPNKTQDFIFNLLRQNFYTKPQLSPEMREELKEIFREDILKLQEIIGRDLSHWLK